jgi:hypothetical protein
VAFVAVEARVREPMLPLELFRRRSFTGVQLAAFAVSGSMFALFLYLTLYLQSILGYTPLEAGVRYLPITVTIFLVAPIAGVLISRVRAQIIMAVGLVLCGTGLLLMSGLESESEWTSLLGGFLVAGAGVGLLNPVIADAALSVVPQERSGMAAGINDTFRQVGVAVGIAAWGAIFLGRGSDRVAEVAAGTPAAAGDAPRRLLEEASSGALTASGGPAPAVSEGFLAGLNQILGLGAGLAFAGAVLVLWLVREHDIERGPLEPGSEPEGEFETQHRAMIME